MTFDPRNIEVPSAPTVEADLSQLGSDVVHPVKPVVTIDTSPQPVPKSIDRGIGERILRKVIPAESRYLR